MELKQLSPLCRNRMITPSGCWEAASILKEHLSWGSQGILHRSKRTKQKIAKDVLFSVTQSEKLQSNTFVTLNGPGKFRGSREETKGPFKGRRTPMSHCKQNTGYRIITGIRRTFQKG